VATWSPVCWDMGLSSARRQRVHHHGLNDYHRYDTRDGWIVKE